MHGGHGYETGVRSLSLPIALIVGEEEDFFADDGTAQSAAELILNECTSSGGEIIAGVEIRVSKELENISVELVCAGFCNNVDLTTRVSPIFGVEVVGEDSEFGDRIKVGNNGGGHASGFFGIRAVHHVSVGGFSLAVDRQGSWVQISRRGKHALSQSLNREGGNGRGGRDARLKGKQIGIAPAVQRQGGNPFA